MKNKMNDILIRNVDASYLYWKIKDDKKIKEYEEIKSKLSENDSTENEDKLKQLSEEIFSFKPNIELDKKDNRYLYSGTITDSLMSRKLRSLVSDSDGAIRTVGQTDKEPGTDYTDLIINLKFKSDIMIITDENKKKYNPNTEEIEETDSKKSKRLISKKKLRKMAYRDGITINGIHYVDFQRTSSKARTGNCLFIDDRYIKAMEEWQTMGIPFRAIVKTEDKENPFEMIDIVSSRSYISLTSSSIIGTLDIDPYSILLIDEVEGQHTMPCNVVDLNPDTNRLQVTKKDYTQKTELWDGQSLADSSIFREGKYYTLDKDGKEVEHTYEDKGFMLLRNHFFKSAIFNTNLQEYYSERFKGVENPVIKDRFGNEFEPTKIKLVTTKNSCKIFKFADLVCAYMIPDEDKTELKSMEDEIQAFINECSEMKKNVTAAKRNLTLKLNKKDSSQEDIKYAMEQLESAIAVMEERTPEIEAKIKELKKPIKFEQERLTWNWYRKKLKDDKEVFGVCKYEKCSKFGDRQQTWYQVLGSLNLSEQELWEIAEPQVNEVNLMKKYPAFLKHGLDMRANETDSIGAMMMKNIMEVNEDITRTSWYVNFRRSYLNSMIKHIYEGKIQLDNSDFCVLVANPYEMLRASVGDKIDTSILSDFQCYNSRYADGEELYGFRSPHICTGNSALLTNTDRLEWKWFNFTDRILIINLWGKGAFLSPIWNGSDTDSDAVFLGNNKVILNAVRKVVKSGNYLVPINGLSPESDPKEYTEEEMATVDGKLSNDFIGKICNLARDLQSLYWHLYNTGTPEKKQAYLQKIYDDICILEVGSNIAIDSAKRRYKGVNLASEISDIRKRPYLQSEGAILDGEKVLIVEKRYKKTLSDETIEKYNKLVIRRNEATTEKEIEEITKEIDNVLMVENIHMVRPEFTRKLKSKPKKKSKKFKDEAEKELYRQKQKLASQERKELEEKIYRTLESPMDRLAKVVREHLQRADRTNFITFTEILNPIPKGEKADYNRIEALKKIAIEGNKNLNQIYMNYKNEKISFDEMYEQKQNTIQNILNSIKYTDIDNSIERKISTWDIHKLIRDVYDIHPKKDKHGKIVRNSEGKIVLDDKRDKRLVGGKEDKACTGQKILQWVYKVFPEEFIAALKENRGTVSYIREITENDTSSEKPIYELYGKKYVIVEKKIKDSKPKKTA